MEEEIKKITSLLEQGNTQEANKVCDAALAADADNAKLYYLKALIMWTESELFTLDRKKFPALLKKATDLDPHYAAPHMLWAYTNQLLGFPSLAEKGYTRALQANPNELEAYGLRGETRCELNKFQEAIEDFSKVLEIQPDSSKAYAMRAYAQKALKDWTGAAEDYSKAIEYDPDCGDEFFGRGECKVQLGDLSGALEDFQKALELEPDNETVLRAVSDLQTSILRSLPQDTPIMEVTLKNGKRVGQVVVNGKLVTLLPLNPETLRKEHLSKLDAKDIERLPQAGQTKPTFPLMPLIDACGMGKLDIVRAHIDAKAELNQELFNETPLIKAVKRNEIEIIKELLKAGADINHKTHNGSTALKVAVDFNHMEALRLLLAQPSLDLNAATQNGDTVFIHACKTNRLEAAKALLAAGADINAKNKLGLSALYLARACRHAELAAWLESVGAREL